MLTRTSSSYFWRAQARQKVEPASILAFALGSSFNQAFCGDILLVSDSLRCPLKDPTDRFALSLTYCGNQGKRGHDIISRQKEKKKKTGKVLQTRPEAIARQYIRDAATSIRTSYATATENIY